MSAQRTVLCFGDSNTYGSIPGESGARFGREVRWPGVLARELGAGWHVVEEGLPGRTTDFEDPVSPYRRGTEYLPPCLASHAPLDAVVIFLGTNDLKTRFAAAPGDIAAGIGTLAQATVSSGCGPSGQTPYVLLLGLPRLGTGLSPEFGGAEEKSAALAGPLTERAAAAGVDVLDLADVTAYSALDGIHLDPNGHEAIGIAVAQCLHRMF
jgi:lysophospholipase L1-like esterase